MVRGFEVHEGVWAGVHLLVVTRSELKEGVLTRTHLLGFKVHEGALTREHLLMVVGSKPNKGVLTRAHLLVVVGFDVHEAIAR